MVRTVMLYKEAKGFTLIEAMIAVLILTVMMLWSARALVGIKNSGVEDVIRQEAVKLGQELVNDVRNEDYTAIPNGNLTQVITRQVSGFDINFTVNRVVAVELVNTAKSVVFTITWQSVGQQGVSATEGTTGRTYIARTMVGR